jgi:lipopolysaccharide export system protein LptA
MAISYRSLVLIALLAAGPVAAQEGYDVVADSTVIDYAKNEVLLRRVKITRGVMSLAADQGTGVSQSTSANFDDSHWLFHGNVKIVTEQGQIAADDADATWVHGELAKALVTGKPAVFEQRNAKNGKPIQGHADVIDYEVGKSLITLSKDAWLSYDSGEMHAEVLKYNLLERKLIADPGEQNSQRVHIKIPPNQKIAPPPKP